jgi:hypothetical protein
MTIPSVSHDHSLCLTRSSPLSHTIIPSACFAGLVESETETCFGSGKFKGAEAEKHVMVIAAANAAAKTVSLSVRAESSELRLALESQLSLLLSAKK